MAAEPTAVTKPDEGRRPSGTVVAAGSRSKKVVHLPADTDEPRPRCGSRGYSATEREPSWREVDWAIYPGRSLCEKCERGDTVGGDE